MGATHQPFSSGDWMVTGGKEEEFVARWVDFLKWTKDHMSGFGSASLVCDAENPSHFISFAEWDSRQSLTAWRSSPDFREKLGACRALCDSFRGGDYLLAVSINK